MGGLLMTTTWRSAMKSPVGAFLLILLATLTGLSRAAEKPYDPVHYEAMRSSGKPFERGSLLRFLCHSKPLCGLLRSGLPPWRDPKSGNFLSAF
jgi:hypothetical protein